MVKSYILLANSFCTFSNILDIITYIGNHGDRGKHGGEKQFKYVTTRPSSPPSVMFHFLKSS